MRKLIISAAALSFSLLSGGALAQNTPLPPKGWAPAGSPVATYGQLKVSGANVQSEKTNSSVQLRGMSFGWTSDVTADSKPVDYYNEQVVAWLAADWKVSLVRAAMGVSDKDGPNKAPGMPYKGNENFHKTQVKTLVNAAIWQGIYVIIDWHSHNATGELNEARPFFREMAGIYKDYPNVIYEIYNEPISDDWGSIKTYANSVISEIRAVDTKNLIIVGTPQYSSQIGQAAQSPLSGTNITYAMHFYCDHSDGSYIPFSNTTNIPIFASEFGISRSSGDGTCSEYNNGQGYGETDTWLDKLDARKVSWANWQVNNRNESSSILKYYSNSSERQRLHKGKWADNDLTDRGKWIRARLRGYPDAPNRTYKVDIEVDGEGTITGGSNISVCDEVTLKATPKAGWQFEGWLINGVSEAKSEYKLEVCYDKVGAAVFFPENLIKNSTFTVLTGWDKYPGSGVSSPELSLVNGELVAAMPASVGAEPYEVRVQYMGGASLTNGKRYRLSFDARAAQARTIQAAFRTTSNMTGGHKINIGEPVSLTTTKAAYTREFNMTEPTTTAGVIAFYLGGQSASVTIDNVKLEEIGGAGALPFARPASARAFSASFNGKSLVLTGGGRSAEVTVYDMAGRVRLKRGVALSGAASLVSLDKLPSGVYSVRYRVDGKAAGAAGRVMLTK